MSATREAAPSYPHPVVSMMMALERLVLFLKRQSRGGIFILAFTLVGIIGFIDYITGYEVTIFPFYSIAILLAVWFGDQRIALAISIGSTMAWWVADTASGHVYSREWLQPWDTIVRFMFFCLVMFAGAMVKQQRDASRARVALLEHLRRLEMDISQVSERERQRIGRDLHDGVCQYLAAIGFTAGLLKKQLETVSPAHAQLASDVADRLNDALVRTRDLSRGLSPVTQEDRGLESALDDLATTSARLMGISCTFVCPEPVPIEDNEVSVHLFRIAQEALNNATKHGRATAIVITLEETEGKLCLAVSDNGIGFHPPSAQQKGIGLSILAYRARSIGGVLNIQKNHPAGTILSCTIDPAESPEFTPELMPYE